ncbi:MAG: GtrA family protein [Eubacteriales bacterium]|nr:GtrA family protein [Eubacteriales bacterium]
MIKRLFLKYKEIISYVFFGVLTTVVNLVSFKIFDSVLGSKMYLLTNIISWVLAVIFAYITNKLWVFESKSMKPNVLLKEIAGFLGARLFSLGVEEAGLWTMIDLLSLDRLSISIFSLTIGGNMIVKLILQVIVVILNYIFSKFIIFAKKSDD